MAIKGLKLYTIQYRDGSKASIKATKDYLENRMHAGIIIGYKPTYISRKEAAKKYENGEKIFIGYQTAKFNKFYKQQKGESFDVFEARVKALFDPRTKLKYKEALDNGECLLLTRIG